MITHIICGIMILDQKSVAEKIPIENVKDQNRSLFLKNIRYANQVDAELCKRGYQNEKCRTAALINGWHESKWDPKCKSGNFVGFFQIGGAGTMGAGTTVAQRQSIPFSVELLTKRSDFNNWYKRHKNSNSSLATTTTDYASSVLRCAPKHVASRGSTADRWGR